MRKVVVFNNLTLDGVMQAPGGADEDTRNGFPYGGWAAPYQAMNAARGASLANVGPMLFGRRTYENFYSYWPHQTGSPFTEVLNNAQKYVASTTLQEPLPWMNSTLLKGPVHEAVAQLKAQEGQDFLILGSGTLVQSLAQHNLIDAYVLLIHPLILGQGFKLFPEGSPNARLKLVESQVTPNGVVIAAYQPCDPAENDAH